MTEISSGFLPRLPLNHHSYLTTGWYSKPNRSGSSSASIDGGTTKILALAKRCEMDRKFAKILPPINPVMTLTYSRLPTDYPILYSSQKLQDIHKGHWNIKKPNFPPNEEVQKEVKSHLKKEFNKKKKRYKINKPPNEEMLMTLKMERSRRKEKTKA